MAPLLMSPAPCTGDTMDSSLSTQVLHFCIGEVCVRKCYTFALAKCVRASVAVFQKGLWCTHLARPLLFVRKPRLQFFMPL